MRDGMNSRFREHRRERRPWLIALDRAFRVFRGSRVRCVRVSQLTGIRSPFRDAPPRPRMSQVRLILALHNHQPVGNFDGVFEDAYRTSYLPFLDVLEGYPELPFVAAHLGPAAGMAGRAAPGVHRAAAADGGVRPGGDPGRRVLRADPDDDPAPGPRRTDQRIFAIPRGDSSAPESAGCGSPSGSGSSRSSRRSPRPGIEYTVLDDAHFLRAGCAADEVLGYYLTEDDGRLLKVFPGSETLRYNIPFREPHATYEFLRRLAERRPGSTVVFADDGEKFGSLARDLRSRLQERLAQPLLRHAAGQPRLAGDHDVRPGPGHDAARREDLPAGRLLSRDDGMGACRPRRRRRTGGHRAGSARSPTPARSSGSSGPADTGATSRRSMPNATRCMPGCWRFLERLAAIEDEPDGRPGLPGSRPPGALSGPVQLPLLAWLVRRTLPAASQERDLPQPDRGG